MKTAKLVIGMLAIVVACCCCAWAGFVYAGLQLIGSLSSAFSLDDGMGVDAVSAFLLCATISGCMMASGVVLICTRKDGTEGNIAVAIASTIAFLIGLIVASDAGDAILYAICSLLIAIFAVAHLVVCKVYLPMHQTESVGQNQFGVPNQNQAKPWGSSVKQVDDTTKAWPSGFQQPAQAQSGMTPGWRPGQHKSSLASKAQSDAFLGGQPEEMTGWDGDAEFDGLFEEPEI